MSVSGMTPLDQMEGKPLPRATALLPVLVCLASAVPRMAWPATQTFPLTPATTTLGLTVYALGLFPIPGTYPRFHGTLELDTDHPGFCRVSITVDQLSLHMTDPARVRKALAPDMLNAAQFPTMSYAGNCQGRQTEGTLTLHGITRPVALYLTRRGGRVTGDGWLNRHDFEVNGMPHMVGPTIKIRFSTTLPMLQPAPGKQSDPGGVHPPDLSQETGHG
jgi:polyisoprenoid-binding protein YceI